MWRALLVLSLLVTSAAADPERDRIRAHLTAAYAHVAAADTSSLSTAQRARRAAAIVDLGRYIERGLFPRRTGDAFGPDRRPRFIDDRGVHCAVGQLIADSGHPALARSLAAQFEYAYVPDIAAASEELRAWATEHGFTVAELAMIQPSYSSPPTKESTRREIHDAADQITVACASMHAAQARVKLEVRGDERGTVAVTAPENTGFAKCVARHATNVAQDRGAWDTEPRTFAYALQLPLRSPQELFASALGELGRSSGCVPRPGAIPRTATVKGTSTKEGLVVSVQTTPRNEEVEACLAERAKQRWRAFAKGAWSLSATRTVAVESQLASGVKQNLSSLASSAAARCRQPDMQGLVTIDVRAKPDDEDFTVTASSTNEAFLTCLRAELREQLRGRFAVGRRLPDGTIERYFRIDSNVSARATTKL